MRRGAQLGAGITQDRTGQHSCEDNSVQHQSLAQEMHELQWVFVSFWLAFPYISVQSRALASAVQIPESGSLGTHSHPLNRTSKQWVGKDPTKCALEVMQSSWFVFFLLIALRKNNPRVSQLLLRPRRNLDPTFTGSPHSTGLRKHGWGRSGWQELWKELWTSACRSPPGQAGCSLPG